MRMVQCGECGKRYNFDEDGFCPKCGAFNQPPRGSRVAADGSVVRVDGINESNHGGSFVHRELHREDRARRRAGLEQPKGLRRSSGGGGRETARRGERKKAPLVVWIILVIAAVNILGNLLRNLMWLW